MKVSGGEYLESIVLENSNKSSKPYFQELQPSIDGAKLNHLLPHSSSPKPQGHKEPDYRSETALEAVLSRGGWLFLFFVGLIFAAMIIELFDEVYNSSSCCSLRNTFVASYSERLPLEQIIERNVELSYFVPLLIGHGGNSGSQSVATVIRAIALGMHD